MTVVLGIDLATADVRVQAVDAETGSSLLELRSPLAVTGLEGTRTQEPRYGELARDLIAAVAAGLGARAAEIRALSITGTSGTVVPVDEAGAPIGVAVLYDDPRGSAELQALAEAGLGVRPSGALARTAWMHRGSPAGRYVFTPDVVAAALAGGLLPSDTSHALKSGIDPVSATWDAAALAVLGLPEERMPQLTAPGRVIGEIADPGSLGLPDGVVIVSGMTDGSTGQIATGAVGLGDTVGVLGTTLVLKAVSQRDIVEGRAGVYSHVAPDGLFWPGGASNSGAGVLGVGDTAGIDPGEYTARIAEFGPADAVTYPLARPGERFPVAAPGFPGFWIALPGGDPRTDTVARFRALYEGVAFVERLGIERLAQLGVDRGVHHLAGGAAVSDAWNRIRATVLGRSVIVSRGAGSARGAAALAASAISGEPLAVTAERFAGARSTVDPDPVEIEALDERYRVFIATLDSRL